MLADMRPISGRRHANALRKELAFWRGHGVLERRAFRIQRYTRPVLAAANRYGPDRIERNLQERVHYSTDCSHPCTFKRAGAERDLLRAGFTIESAVILEQDRIRSEIAWTCSALPRNR